MHGMPAAISKKQQKRWQREGTDYGSSKRFWLFCTRSRLSRHYKRVLHSSKLGVWSKYNLQLTNLLASERTYLAVLPAC